MNKKQVLLTLFVILFIGGALRLIDLGKGDIITDEVFYGFRAIELVDFSEADTQTTPLEWFDPDIPSWTQYSFHDHPPLVFVIQHLSISVFGETPFAIRFPSVIAGVVSVLLVFLIASQFFDKRAALLSAAFLAVTVNHVYVSRLALQESYSILFMLLTMWLLIKALDREKYFILMGVSLGLALLTKFTTVLLIPIIGTSLIFFKKEAFLNKKLWLGLLLAIILFSPVIYYNINLYKAVGHFDFQFSYLAGQDPDVWKTAPGKDIGSITQRFKEFIPNIFSTYSWAFTIISLASILFSLFILKRKSVDERTGTGIVFSLLIFIYTLLLLSFIGPSFRFLTLLGPIFALFIAAAFVGLMMNKRKYVAYIFIVILLFEIAFSVNTFLLKEPIGKKNITYSQARNDTYQWGYNKLAQYLDSELAGKKPENVLTMTYTFLNDLHDVTVAEYKESNLESYSTIILYDENIFYVPQLWYFDRLNIYHAWPVMKIGTFLQVREQEPEFTNQFKNVYAVIATENTLLRQTLTSSGQDFEEELTSYALEPIRIVNEEGKESFRIYKYSVD